MRLTLRIVCFHSLILLLLLPTGSSFAQGDWTENGVPLTGLYPSDIFPGGMASDGSSGAIVVYSANYGCRPAIYAQHVDSLGVTSWPETNMIFSTDSRAYGLQVISDGAGGAIFTGYDQRSGDYDLFIQRIDSSGSGQWAENGVLLSTAAGDQTSPHLMPDGSGGAIIAWSDERSGNDDIYIQRIDSSGNAQWAANGVALCTAVGDQWYPRVISDGAGGALVVWMDARFGSYDIYAQRINGSGVAQWAANGVVLCGVSGDQWSPRFVSDGAGGAVVTWYDNRSGNDDIYAQRVDNTGAVQWSPHGIPICTTPEMQRSPKLISNGAGGAIITWLDQRSGNNDIYVQRVDGSGNVLWTVNGQPLCTATDSQSSPIIASDGAGGAVVVWEDSRKGYNDIDVWAQRVDGSGAVLWAANGIPISSAKGGQTFPSIIEDDAGGVIVSWRDQRTGMIANVPELYAQRMDFSGAMKWTTDGVALTRAMGDQTDPDAISDGSDGAIVAWEDVRDGGLNVYTQRVDGNGTMQWTAGGVAVCNAEGAQSSPKITPDGAGGAVITWADGRNGSLDIYAQRLNHSGALQWAAEGVVLCADTMYQSIPIITSDGAGGGIVAWIDYRAGNYDIYAQRVDGGGAVQWAADGIPICTEPAGQNNSFIVADGAGGAILCWADERNGDQDIYAQRVDGSGIVQWTADGIPLCTQAGYQVPTGMLSDGAGGAIVIWEDQRSGNMDVFAQRIDGMGTAQWMPDGLILCAPAGDQTDPHGISDGGGGAIVTWVDMRSGGRDIYAQRVSASGALQWTGNGAAVCTAAEDQLTPSIASFGSNGCVITWADKRMAANGGYPFNQDIYGQHLNGNGIGQWTADGVVVCDAAFLQKSPQLVSSGLWSTIVVWLDQDCGYFDMVYAQQLSYSGVIVSTLLQDYSVGLDNAGITIDWTLSEMDRDVSFSVARAEASRWIFETIDNATIERSGLSFSFSDAGCTAGAAYRYRVEYRVGDENPRMLFETDNISIPAPEVQLYASYPNPFNPTTTITFSLPRRMHAKLSVLNVEGRLVKTLIATVLDGGHQATIWDGTNDHGNPVSSGVYFYRLQAGKKTLTKKMVLLK